MLHTLFALMLACPQAATQSSDGAGTEPENQGWTPFNGASLIVNERIITRSDIAAQLAREQGSMTTPEDRARRAGEVIERLVRFMLLVQAGRDLGFDRDLVKRLVRDQMEERLETAGSVVEFSRGLERSRLTSHQLSEDTESQIYRQLFVGSVNGRYPGTGGRAHVDRYVRPGQVWLEYKRILQRNDLASEVQLQQMVIDPRRLDGTLQAAFELADRLREQVLSGSDFGDVVEEQQAAEPGTRGLTRPRKVSEFAAQFPEIADFLAGAQVGDISQVLPYRRGGEVIALMVVKLVDRRRTEETRFDDRKFQGDLIERVREGRDRYHEEQATGRLFDSAYVWPPEAFSRQSKTGRASTSSSDPEPEAPR